MTCLKKVPWNFCHFVKIGKQFLNFKIYFQIIFNEGKNANIVPFDE